MAIDVEPGTSPEPSRRLARVSRQLAADVSPLEQAKGRSLLVEGDEAEFAPGEKERAKRSGRHFDPEKEERDKFFEALKAEGIEIIRS